MLYNTKLNEFEPKEINAIIGLVQDKILDLTHKYQTLTQMDPSDLRARLMLDVDNQIGALILWKVQLANALSDIEEMNKINVG